MGCNIYDEYTKINGPNNNIRKQACRLNKQTAQCTEIIKAMNSFIRAYSIKRIVSKHDIIIF